MDPNKALADLREAVKAITEDDFCCADHGELAGQDLAEKFAALDEWLTKGGFPPNVWVH